MPEANKRAILEDIRRVAAELKRPPSRDEYVGYHGKKYGIYSERQIKNFFNTWRHAVAQAGLAGYDKESVLDKGGFQIAKLTTEVEGLRQYVRKLEKDALTSSSLRELIGAIDERQVATDATDWLRGPRDVKQGLTGIPTLFLSDIHFDEVVAGEQVNYVNEYDHEIAVARIRNTFERAVDLTKHFLAKPIYDGFILALGGDILSGNIHEELAETNDQRINQSLIDITDLLIEGIAYLADEFGRVFVPCVVGNHGRLHKKPRYKFRVHDNYEWLVYQFLSRHFKKDDRVSFLIPDAPDAQWSLYGCTYNLNHGDQFKGGSGISGIFSPLMLGMARKQKKQNAIGQPFDIMMNGHWHQYIHTDSLIVNGSIKGYDEFANMHNFNYERPQQALFIRHPTKGETFRMPVLCDKESKLKRKPASKLSWDETK